MLITLPPTKDSYWRDADTYTVDIKDLTDTLCKEHVYDVYMDKREVRCPKCGSGGRFSPSNTTIEGDMIIFGEKSYKLGQIYGRKETSNARE